MKKIGRLVLLIIFVVSAYQLIRDMLHTVHLAGIWAKLRQPRAGRGIIKR